MWTGGKSACNVEVKSGNGNGNGRLPTCIIATTCNEKREREKKFKIIVEYLVKMQNRISKRKKVEESN